MVKRRVVKKGTGKPKSLFPGFQFIPTNPTPLIKLQGDLREESLEKMIARFAKETPRGAIVSIEVKVDEETLPDLKAQEIMEALPQASFVRQVKPVIVKGKALRIEGQDPALGEKEAVKNFVKETKPPRAKTVLKIAYDLLERGGRDAG